MVMTAMTTAINDYSNLNNNGNSSSKRLSSLQRLILTVLSETQSPDGLVQRVTVAREVAKRYGKGSIETRDDRAKILEKKGIENYARWREQNPEQADRMLELYTTIIVATIQRYRNDEWLTAKFSVSWHRSLRNLIGQGLVEERWMFDCRWLRITAKGRELLKSSRQ
jgi:hypothetical protein